LLSIIVPIVLCRPKNVLSPLSSKNGVTIEGKRYVCSATRDLIGLKLLAWYDPEHDDQVVLTDRDRKNVWIAERYLGDGMPAVDAGDRLGLAAKQGERSHERDQGNLQRR